MEYFYEGDEPYPMASVTEPPEWAISIRESYATGNDSELGATTFHSMVDLNELAPQTIDSTMNYHTYHI